LRFESTHGFALAGEIALVCGFALSSSILLLLLLTPTVVEGVRLDDRISSNVNVAGLFDGSLDSVEWNGLSEVVDDFGRQDTTPKVALEHLGDIYFLGGGDSGSFLNGLGRAHSDTSDPALKMPASSQEWGRVYRHTWF